jgi:hypothetical protein
MGKLVALFSVFTLSLFSFAQQYKGKVQFSRVSVLPDHYQEEYTFDTTINPAAWTSEEKGLHVSFASTDQLYFRSEVPQLEKETLSWEATGWKGERLNAVILVWSPDTLQQVRFVASDLKNSNGKVLSKNDLQLNMVRYVLSNYPYGAKDAVCGIGPYKDLYLMPDRFEAFERFELPGNSVRPVWLTLNVPAVADAGSYNGTVEVKTAKSTVKLQLKVTVQNQVLPKPYDWKFRLDLWQNPSIISLYYGIKPWSDEFKTLLKKHLKLYADAGAKFVTANVIHSVWADETYESMVEWIKKKDGTWKFGYDYLDQYVELAKEVGIDKAITIYSPIPYGEAFRYLDEATGNYVYERWSPMSDTFRTNWHIFLTDLKSHLEKKGWFDKTYIGINENAPDQTLAAIKMVRDHSPKWKITYAGDWHPQLDTLLNDYCFIYGKESDVTAVESRHARGSTTTFYNCCTPPIPNNFVFSPPIEGRWLGWYASAHKYDGFLRWAYDTWPSDVMRDARNMHWTGPAGDCFMVYPGGASCIRFEKLREGISDYEKIRILREKALTSKNKDVQNLIEQLNEHFKTFLAEKDFDSKKITADVNKGKEIVDALSEKLPAAIVAAESGK